MKALLQAIKEHSSRVIDGHREACRAFHRDKEVFTMRGTPMQRTTSRSRFNQLVAAFDDWQTQHDLGGRIAGLSGQQVMAANVDGAWHVSYVLDAMEIERLQVILASRIWMRTNEDRRRPPNDTAFIFSWPQLRGVQVRAAYAQSTSGSSVSPQTS